MWYTRDDLDIHCECGHESVATRPEVPEAVDDGEDEDFRRAIAASLDSLEASKRNFADRTICFAKKVCHVCEGALDVDMNCDLETRFIFFISSHSSFIN